jgi:hypothetical protein
MALKFVNMIVQNYITSLYSLHRIDHAKHLFHKTREAAQKAENAAMKRNKRGFLPTISSCKSLPKAAVNFSAGQERQCTLPAFLLSSERTGRGLCFVG